MAFRKGRRIRSTIIIQFLKYLSYPGFQITSMQPFQQIWTTTRTTMSIMSSKDVSYGRCTVPLLWHWVLSGRTQNKKSIFKRIRTWRRYYSKPIIKSGIGWKRTRNTKKNLGTSSQKIIGKAAIFELTFFCMTPQSILPAPFSDCTEYTNMCRFNKKSIGRR